MGLPVLMILLFVAAAASLVTAFVAVMAAGIYMLSAHIESSPRLYRVSVRRMFAALTVANGVLLAIRLALPEWLAEAAAVVPIPAPRLALSLATQYLMYLCAQYLPFLSLNWPLLVAGAAAAATNLYSLVSWAVGPSNPLRYTHEFLALGPIFFFALLAPTTLLIVSTASDLALPYGDTILDQNPNQQQQQQQAQQELLLLLV